MFGFINVYKEKGWTSHDVVAKMRGILKTRKIGHAGTLDPQVEGVLVLAVGPATKLLKYMEETDKGYQVEMIFGLETDTQDLQGTVINRKPVDHAVFSQLAEVMEAMQGDLLQVPPMYSAVKINGQKMYQLARKGQEVERKPRLIHIKEVSKVKGPWSDDQGTYHLSFHIVCSKGTYVRTYCQDLARALGTLGVMSDLVRTRVGLFDQDKALTLAEIEDQALEKDFSFLQSPLDVLPIAKVTVRKKSVLEAISHGQSINISDTTMTDKVQAHRELLLISEQKELLAIASLAIDENILKMKKVFTHEGSPS